MSEEVETNTARDYLRQIAEIDEALLTAEGEDELNLLSIKNDILDLIQLLQEPPAVMPPSSSSARESDRKDSFQAKKSPLPDASSSQENEFLVGSKCSAPYEQSWGYCVHHNAIIASEDSTRVNNERMVRVLYTNPIHKKMVPCQYYLNGDCRFDDKSCRFSHGELIPYNKLKNYREPDYKILYDSACAVLVKTSDKDVWSKGVSLYLNADSKSFRVKLDNNEQIDCLFENIFPLKQNDNDDIEDDYNNKNIDDLKSNYNPWNLFNIVTDEVLGEWEKHTKGIGSKLMEKMGYIKGEGLGSRKQGIVNPVSCQILPAGCSLDYCAQLKEQANDGDLFSAEKKLKKMQRKHEKMSQENYIREKNKTDLFSFINTQVLTSCGPPNDELNNSLIKKKVCSVDLKNHSTKTLNVENFKLGENIRKLEGEITKVKQSLARQRSGTEIHKHISGLLDGKNKELASLKLSEKTIDNEKKARKEKGKLFHF